LFVYHQTDQKIDAVLTVLTIEQDGGVMAYAPRGPIVDFENIELVNTLVDEALENLPAHTYMLRMDPEVADSKQLAQKYTDAGYKVRNDPNQPMHYNIQPRKNVVLSYQGINDEEELMLHFKRDYRNQIRRAAKEGVVVDFGDDKQHIDDFFQLYVKMATAQSITHRPIEYFDRMLTLWAGKSELFRIYIARLNDQPIAAGIGFGYGDEIWYMYAGSDRDYAKYYGPYAVQWEMIKWGLQAGKTEYDFGGVSEFDSSDGLYTFKHGFAYSDQPAIYIGEVDKIVDSDKYYGNVN
jgi:lipid II:glycine glycyltransferase (peptidoglycan interpeptide bridge formation enzyme)